jgi:hypothetical protein
MRVNVALIRRGSGYHLSEARIGVHGLVQQSVTVCDLIGTPELVALVILIVLEVHREHAVTRILLGGRETVVP